jgi:hypothetical protein
MLNVRINKRMDAEIQKEINKISKLAQYQNKPLEWLEKKAIVNVKMRSFIHQNIFQDMDEQDLAEDLFAKYLSEYDFDSTSDILRLQDLIFKYILKNRVQKRLNELTSEKDAEGKAKKVYCSSKDVEPLIDLEKAINEDKLALGIDRVDDEKKDELTGLQMLVKRFEKYINFNRNEFTTVCAKCGNLLLLRRRVKDFECLGHPWFSGRFLWNTAIMDDVEKKIITLEQAAKYLRTSSDYVLWALKNKDEIINIPGLSQEEIKDFVETNPYLKNSEVENRESNV